MRMVELIAKKREGGELSREEIRWMIHGFTMGEIPDYQMSAMCMAIYYKGMSLSETYDLTMAMTDSGERIDLSEIDGVKVDKHSTGGVGDKTSLVLCPMLAACGMKMAKLSGRGLGFTGGTIDKLESIPGFSTSMSMRDFMDSVKTIGFAVAGQTANLCPADKKLYALRDVTATVSSMPLIVSSILSKKIASGADAIVLDVKSGSGAFMSREEDAVALARQLVRVGTMAGRKVTAVVSDMDQPLGHAVGNALEIKETISALRGEYAGDLLELCFVLGSQLLVSTGFAEDDADARARMKRTIDDGSALGLFERFIGRCGGDTRVVHDLSLLPAAPVVMEVPSPVPGYVKHIAAAAVGTVEMRLGGGRETKDSKIDLSVGILLNKKVGDYVTQGESLAQIHAKTREDAERAAQELLKAYTVSAKAVIRDGFIREIVNN